MIIIPLSQGLIAVVDDADAYLAESTWAAGRRQGVWYAFRNVDRVGEPRTTQYLHHSIMGDPPEPGLVVDHKDGCGTNCTRENMRWTTHQTNLHNIVRTRCGASSGFIGVRAHRDKWTAYIKANNKQHRLGTFATKEEANIARLKAEGKLWGIQPRRRTAFIAAGLCSDQEED